MVRWLRQQEILFTLLNPKFSITAWARADPRITFLLSHQVCRRRSRDSHIKRVDSFRMWWAGHFHHTATNTRNTGRDTFHFYWLYYQIYFQPAGDMKNLRLSIHISNLCFVDIDIRLLQSNIVRSVSLFVWFVYFLSYKNSTCKVNNISCKNIIL